jgi:flagellar biosynthesis/type III secretory pathway M-ring protein FliF/YscJ
VVNYEVDKTVKVVREVQRPGASRLSAAVVINHRTTVDKAGKETSAPIPAAAARADDRAGARDHRLQQATAVTRSTW